MSSRCLFDLKALKKKGIDYCINQIYLGVEQFGKITLGDYSNMKECFVSFPLNEDSGANSNFDWTNKSDSNDDADDVNDDETDSNFGTNSYDNLDENLVPQQRQIYLVAILQKRPFRTATATNTIDH